MTLLKICGHGMEIRNLQLVIGLPRYRNAEVSLHSVEIRVRLLVLYYRANTVKCVVLVGGRVSRSYFRVETFRGGKFQVFCTRTFSALS